MEVPITAVTPEGDTDRRLVTARVPFAPVPVEPPPELANYVGAVTRDDVPTPLDWVLDPARFITSAPLQDMEILARRFADWRMTWAARFPLSEAHEVGRFGAFAAAEGFESLGRLSAAAAFYDPDELEQLDGELAMVEGVLSSVDAPPGWWFLDTSDGAVMRVVTTPGRLVGGPDWEVSAVAGRGIRMRVGSDVYDLDGWSLSRNGVALCVAGRSTEPEPHVVGAAARGLAQLAPSAAHVSIESAPRSVLWTPMLSQLTDAVTVAVSGDAAIVVAPEL